MLHFTLVMTHVKRLILVLCAVGLLTAAYERINTPALMSDAAHAFLNSLTPEQRAKVVYSFDDAERLMAKHRIENPGTETLHIIEVQSGSYLGEDDIVRFEDSYGRSS